MATKNVSKNQWIYIYDDVSPVIKNGYELTEVRYVLGEQFPNRSTSTSTNANKSLVCIGINPSTALPGDLDNTLKRVQNYAKNAKDAKGNYVYDSWYMVNLYPQREIKPKKLRTVNQQIFNENIRQISNLISKKLTSADIWLAWGELKTKTTKTTRQYLVNSLNAIQKAFNGFTLYAYGKTKYDYPKHPLVMRKKDVLKNCTLYSDGKIQ